MARLHWIIEKLYSTSATDLVFETGSTGYFRFPQGKRAVYRESLTTEQIIGLFAEVVPPTVWKKLDGQGTARVGIESPAGPVEITLTRKADGIAAAVRPTANEPREEWRSETGSAFEDESKTAQILSGDPGQAMAQLLKLMFEKRASDLHLVAGNPPIFRIDGDLVPAEDLDVLDPERLRAMIWSIAPERNREEWNDRHDTDFAHETEDARFRVNVFANRYGIAAVLRQIPNEILTAEQLNLPQSLLDLCYLTKGLVLVTGPTGSGKSTTLAALIDYINRHRSDHILTIEDPIEFVHKNKRCLVNQREVGVHTESFKRALRAALREDPDIILVGELRDLETISIAIETAETGHLVFGTLHTTTAPSTVDRLIDQFPSDQQEQIRVMLSESLKGVIAQTLCKKVGGGRVAALEILLVNHAISNLIREGKTFQIPSIMQTSKGRGMCTLNDSLLELVKKGVIEPEEAYRKAVAKQELLAAMEKDGFRIERNDQAA
jgi:twitching motility protein PilT